MDLVAYVTWMALEECEKYRLIRRERDEIMAALSGVVMRVMARVGDDHPFVGGRVVTLEEQEDVMHEMALEQYKKLLVIRIEASRIKLIAPWIPTSYMADLAKANLDVAKTFNKIAVIYKTQKKYELAVYNFKKCLAIQIKYLGANNLDVGYTKLHIAEVRTFMHRAGLRATAAVLRRAERRAERRASRAKDRIIERARNFALRHPEWFF